MNLILYFLTKIIFNNIEFDLLEHPIKIFQKLYGSNTKLIYLISQRFEMFWGEKLDAKGINYLFTFLKNFIPNDFLVKNLYLYNLLLIDYTLNYRTFRHLFNLPVNGQRTWGGGKSIKITKSQLFNYKLKKYVFTAKLPYILFLAEVVNMMWKFQWYHEWWCSYRYMDRLPWYVKRKKKFVSLSMIINKRIESFFKHPYKGKKKKHHRKKKIIDRHTVSTGLPIGFSWDNRKNLKF